MKNLVRYTFVQIAILFLVFAVQAQKPTPTPTPKTTVEDTSKTFEVRLPVTVKNKKKDLVSCEDANAKKNTEANKDKKKDSVQCFTKNDFIVLEDGVPQQVTFFSDEKTNPPVYVGVLMVVRLRKDKAAFMTFDNEINLLQDFTDKLDLLDKAVDKVKKVGSQTALYDAIWQFSEEKLRSAPGRRVIVIITDGDDTFSRASLNDAIDIAQRTETTIFAISTKEGFLGAVPGVEAGTVKDKGDKYLERLCDETGGEAFFTGDLYALEKSFKKISEELRSQYIITYRPANQEYDGRKRKIEVQFKSKDNADKFKIRSKTEYRSVRDTLK
jgi:Ca-activated chloride channel homolog